MTSGDTSAHDSPEPVRDLGPLVTAYEAEHEFEARAVVVVLADAGITAFVFAGGTVGYSDPIFGMSSRVPVQVAESQVEQARRALREAKYVGASIDWDDVDVGESEPESRLFVPLTQAVGRALAMIGWVVGVAAIIVTVAGALVLLFR
ncbi:MAG: DUF2007 domain-containing protein [Phycisphaerae bacterium]|nr:DUF2007 domain-containing protein [Phycisphaerae bacterium]